jgi:protein-ribulosamine 3-kinase
MLPAGVRAWVEDRLGAIRAVEPVGGGCVGRSARLETAAGPAFLKYLPDPPAGLFAAEAAGMGGLAEARSGLRVPRVLDVRDPAGAADGAALLLEWLEPAPADRTFSEALGHGLAALHRAGEGGWGGGPDGFIGALPQANAAADGWAEFWRARRLEPQLRLAHARDAAPADAATWDRLFGALPALLQPAEAEGASLLHGDLWSGNVLATREGPALVDPAAYTGHREVDLAMADLFGGFDARFHAAYAERWPLTPGYAEARRGVYQLYYLLVHVNLFGAAYARRTHEVLRRVLAAL